MTQPHHECLSDEQLEMVALGDCQDQHALQHFDQCELCKSKIDEIQSNNLFLDLFAQADPLASDTPKSTPKHEDEAIPEIPGGYKVECELHRGGHGVVYRATQIRTNRPVAIKMLILGTMATPRQRTRFEREAEIVATLRHPGIVPIYDAGYLDDGRFAFAMEYIDGVTLDRWAAQTPVETQDNIRARLQLFLLICDAVNFAHQYGVVHRDLKPANILIDKDNKPHILDFGIAKVFNEDADTLSHFGQSSRSQDTVSNTAHHTMPGEFSGTLAYASPEQVAGDPKRIDLRTDIYSLGIILYELLSGKLPYSASGSVSDIVNRIQRDEPNPITQHISFIPRDLSEIMAHALQKDKLDRYESVHDLSHDIQNYLEGKPIQIRRDSAWYVVRKTVRRKWLAATLFSISLLALALFSIAMTALYIQKNHAETNAILQLRSANIAHAHTEGLVGDASLALDMLWSAQLEETKGLDAPKELLFGSAIEPIDSYWELWSFYARNPCLKTTEIKHELLNGVAISADNKTIVSYKNNQLHFYTLADHQLLRTVDVNLPEWFSFINSGTMIGLIDNGQSVLLLGTEGIVLFDAHTGHQISTHRRPNSPHHSVKLILSDGKIAYSEVDRQLVIIDPLQDYLELHLDTDAGDSLTTTINSTDTLLATTTLNIQNYVIIDSTINIWNMPEGTLLAQHKLPGSIGSALFTPDMTSILLPHYLTGKQTLWNFSDTTVPLRVMTTLANSVPRAWLNDGKQVVCIGRGQEISIWDIQSKEKVDGFTGTSDNIRHAVPGPSKSTLTVVGGQSIKTWSLNNQLWRTFPKANEHVHHGTAISPNGLQLAWAKNQADDYQLHISSLDPNAQSIVIDDHKDLITSIAFNHRGNQIAWALANGQVTLWDIENNTQINTFNDHNSGVRTIAMSPTQNILATGGEDAQVILRDLSTGKIKTLAGHSQRIPKVIFRPDGRVLASASMDGTIRLWDVQTGSLIKVIDLEQGIYALSFSPDNVHLAAGGRGQNITIINTRTDQHTTLQGDSNRIFALAYGPEGRVLVSGDVVGNISLWDTQSTKRLAKLPKHEQMVMSINVSADGQSMVSSSAGQSPELRLWDLTVFNQHIAGNLEFHASQIEKRTTKKPANLGAMQAWAAKIHGPQQ